MFKELGELPAEALESLSSDLSRPVRQVIVVNEVGKDRRKRGSREQVVLLLGEGSALLYRSRTKGLSRLDPTAPLLQRAIEYSHHKTE